MSNQSTVTMVTNVILLCLLPSLLVAHRFGGTRPSGIHDFTAGSRSLNSWDSFSPAHYNPWQFGPGFGSTFDTFGRLGSSMSPFNQLGMQRSLNQWPLSRMNTWDMNFPSDDSRGLRMTGGFSQINGGSPIQSGSVLQGTGFQSIGSGDSNSIDFRNPQNAAGNWQSATGSRGIGLPADFSQFNGVSPIQPGSVFQGAGFSGVGSVDTNTVGFRNPQNAAWNWQSATGSRGLGLPGVASQFNGVSPIQQGSVFQGAGFPSMGSVDTVGFGNPQSAAGNWQGATGSRGLGLPGDVSQFNGVSPIQSGTVFQGTGFPSVGSVDTNTVGFSNPQTAAGNWQSAIGSRGLGLPGFK